MALPELALRPNARHARVLRGHPWVFGGELATPPPASLAGQSALLRDARGHLLGSGLVNPKSSIAWRRYSLDPEPLDPPQLHARLDSALARRPADHSRRLVWSEADDLPGLVIDQFEDVCVVQLLTLGMDQRRESISAWLQSSLAPTEIIFRNDAPAREREGIKREVFCASGRPYPARDYTIDGFTYRLDLMHAQKTGFYLDQRAQHSRVATFAQGRRVLDGCCHLGSFALHAARSGATAVLAVDASLDALETANATARRHRLDITFIEENIFDYLNANRTQRFGLIVLDPPSFARNRESVPGALRGYKELNLRALQMLEPGGILATYSCSFHVGREPFLAMLAEAAHDARRTVTLLEETSQPPDHPIRIGFPESHYLTGALLRAEA